MKTIAQDQKRTESLLQRKGIRLHDIQSFSFMKRFHEVPRKSNLKVKDKYGAGILTLRLKQGIQRAFYVHPFQKPSSVIRYLISQDIPFDIVQRDHHTGTLDLGDPYLSERLIDHIFQYLLKGFFYQIFTYLLF